MPGPSIRRWLPLVVAYGGGCATAIGTLPAVSLAPPPAVKLIRPAARAEACRWSVLGLMVGADPPPLDAALARLAAADPEIDTLIEVEVRTSHLTTGVLNRSCVGVKAAVGRVVPAIVVPKSDGHHHH